MGLFNSPRSILERETNLNQIDAELLITIDYFWPKNMSITIYVLLFFTHRLVLPAVSQGHPKLTTNTLLILL